VTVAGRPAPPRASLLDVIREWGRLGCIGFGGPAVHISLLRELCVERRGWISAAEFERAVGATALLPGPASTQLAIYCAWLVRGPLGAIVGGALFIAPGLVVILALAAAFLAASPPAWLRGAGAGAGAVVAAVAVQAGVGIGRPLLERSPPRRRLRLVAYGLAGAGGAALVGEWLVLILVGCGLIELGLRRRARVGGLQAHGWPLLPLLAARGGLGALSWTALKVGALSFGGGFVIVPLMQRDAVHIYHWMTDGQFLNAVALGQVTPGPVVLTVAAVGYGAHGLGGGLLGAAVAFAPSFLFVLAGASRFGRLTEDHAAHAFIGGAAPAAVGAIIGASIPLASALQEGWQFAVLGVSAVALLAWRRPVVPTLIVAGFVGALAVAVFGAPAPH
jgi:chromate transporter